MAKRTHYEIAQAINELSRGQFYVERHGLDRDRENLFWFSLSTQDVLYFTPYDLDSTLVQGLQNQGLLKE